VNQTIQDGVGNRGVPDVLMPVFDRKLAGDASHLAMRGVHIRALQELLGHKTLIMTQRYSHLAPEQLQNAVKLLDGVIGERGKLVGQVVS
jgi:site-specific recombinase XerC